MKNKILTCLSTLAVCCVFSCSGQSHEKKEAAVTQPESNEMGPTPALATLPEPYATKSVRNFSKVIGWDSGHTPKAPEGFTVSRFGSDFKSPRWIYVLPNGDVLVAETKMEPKGLKKAGEALVGANKSSGNSDNMNRITILRDKNHDGKPELQDVFLSGLNMPFGMLVVGDHFYVACTDALWRFPYKEGDLKITAAGEKILDLPGDRRHWTKNIITNKQKNKIYIAIGSGSNVGEDGIDKEARRARIIEVDLDGRNEKVYAYGLRNPVGMDWQPGTGVLWTAVNERDELGDDLVPDYITSVKEGGFYGWPYSYFGNHLDPRISEKDRRPDLVDKAIVPDVEVGPHTASLGFMFYTKDRFPAKYHNGAFIGQHGSWNRSVPTGYKVMFVPFTNGKAGRPEDFLTGFMENPEKNEVHGRPVGVVQMHDGSLLVADDAGNSVWRVSYGK